MNSRITDYTQQRSKVEKRITELNRQIALNSLYRLLGFALIVTTIILYFKQDNGVWLISAFLLTILFLFLLKRHVRLTDDKSVCQSESYVLEREIKYLQGDFSSLDKGEKFRDNAHSYASDLDVFGEQSLFQVINRTFLPGADNILVEKLLNPQQDKTRIQELSETYNELAYLKEFREKFMTHARIVNQSSVNVEPVIKWLSSEGAIKSNAYRLLPVLFSAMSLIVFLLVAIKILPLSAIIILLSGGLIITSFRFKFINRLHNMLAKSGRIMFNYSRLLALIEKTEFKTGELKKLRREFYVEETSPQKIFIRLSKLINAFDSRLNIMVSLILNGFFLWDFYLIHRLLKWKKLYGKEIPNWVHTLKQIDAYASMSTFVYNHPEFCQAKITNNDYFVIRAVEVAHPLMPESVRVANDFSMQNSEIILLTGANMSGKSTFLRTLGVNMILAMNGLPVCTKEFEFTPINVFSSMRTTDSLSKNESYFYAELSRLKMLTEIITEGKSVFFLLDEILKGTNSEDKRKGSMLYLEKLINSKIPGILATHDISLTQMYEKHPNIIRNCCFEIEIREQDIIFDYKLRQGVTQNMNALKLMEQYKLL